MNLIVIGIGELKVANTPGSVLRTFALGSCIGVALVAPRLQAAGLLHFALPDSSINQELALERPGYVKIAGGANIMDPEETFRIGSRNTLAVKKHLWRYKLGAVAEDVGDHISRTMSVVVDTGRVIITSPGNGRWEL